MISSSKRMDAVRASALLVLSTVACSAPPAQEPARAPVVTSAPAPAPAASGPKVAFLGDSISAGLHLPSEQAFPAVVQRTLAARGKSFELLNAGLSGDTTAGGLRRVDWILKQKPALVVVELGANDGMRGQPVAEVEKNLRAIVERIRERGAAVLLLGMRIPPSYGQSYVAAFDAIYPRVAKEVGVPLVPFFMEGVAADPKLNLPDGIHPTKEGHERLAENLAGPLERALSAL
ncbi:MAG TPA: arylesterase [Polyangiales bacterium]|nr:arylesterase [Polyangiales bacterium]